MSARYHEPLPEYPTALIYEFEDIEPNDQDMGMCGFQVEGWGLYSQDGRRARHNSRTFVLREISSVELIVANDDRHPRNARTLGAAALRESTAARTLSNLDRSDAGTGVVPGVP
jgi:hypothetical protein